MFEIKKLSDELSVSGQIEPAEMSNIASHGFQSIIGNRPDDEASGQPDWQSIAMAAASMGLEARHIPVGAEHTVDEQYGLFAHALAEMPKPILAFCRTGNRSTQLFEAAQNAAQNHTKD